MCEEISFPRLQMHIRHTRPGLGGNRSMPRPISRHLFWEFLMTWTLESSPLIWWLWPSGRGPDLDVPYTLWKKICSSNSRSYSLPFGIIVLKISQEHTQPSQHIDSPKGIGIFIQTVCISKENSHLVQVCYLSRQWVTLEWKLIDFSCHQSEVLSETFL